MRIEISLFQGTVPMSGSAKITYDGAGKSTRYRHDATTGTDIELPGTSRKPNPANLFVQVEVNLNTPGSNSLAYLDRVTLVDSTGILARYDKINGQFVKVFP